MRQQSSGKTYEGSTPSSLPIPRKSEIQFLYIFFSETEKLLTPYNHSSQTAEEVVIRAQI